MRWRKERNKYHLHIVIAIKRKYCDNYQNIENIDNYQNIENIDNYQNVENIDNNQNIENIDNIDNYQNIDNNQNIENIDIYQKQYWPLPEYWKYCENYQSQLSVVQALHRDPPLKNALSGNWSDWNIVASSLKK